MINPKKKVQIFEPFFVFISRPEIGCHLNNLKDGKANRAQKET
jgi:hypothetical protein